MTTTPEIQPPPIPDNPSHKDLCRAMGAVIRMERDRLKFSQDDMAFVSGVERRTISNLERGDTDKIKHFAPIAWALGWRLGKLLDKAEALIIDDDMLDAKSARTHALLAEREEGDDED